jgi:hypothetical protein
MSVQVTQRLLIVGALVWALLPWWGAPCFLGAWLVLLVATRRRQRDARAAFDLGGDALRSQLSPEAFAWARRHALYFTWPQTAARWAHLWQLTVLVAVLLAPWFLLRALFLSERGDLWLLAPLAGLFVAAGLARLSLTGEKVNHAQYGRHKPAHEEAASVLAMRRVVGTWPPAPAPDVEPGLVGGTAVKGASA